MTVHAPILIGLDLEDVERWRDPARRISDYFTADELARAAQMADPAPHYAGWWCAREAVYKALNAALPDLGFREIRLSHTGSGAAVELDRYPEWAAATTISITNTEMSAAAVALCIPPTP